MNTSLTFNRTAVQSAQPRLALQPMPFRLALPLFAVPALLTCAAFHFFRPWLETLGYPSLVSYLGAMTVALALLFAGALIMYHRVERYPLTWEAFATRMRFPALRRRDLVYALVMWVIMFIGYGLFSQVGLALANAHVIPLPTNLPAIIDPRSIASAQTWTLSAGGVLRGRWDIALLYLVLFVFNIVGEELWWRGVVLPRQELVHGRFTWLIHGVMWTLFHIFKWWDLIGLIPVCLTISYAAQRLKTNWPGLIAHALFNVTGLLLVIALVAGWIS